MYMMPVWLPGGQWRFETAGWKLCGTATFVVLRPMMLRARTRPRVSCARRGVGRSRCAQAFSEQPGSVNFCNCKKIALGGLAGRAYLCQPCLAAVRCCEVRQKEPREVLAPATRMHTRHKLAWEHTGKERPMHMACETPGALLSTSQCRHSLRLARAHSTAARAGPHVELRPMSKCRVGTPHRGCAPYMHANSGLSSRRAS